MIWSRAGSLKLGYLRTTLQTSRWKCLCSWLFSFCHWPLPADRNLLIFLKFVLQEFGANIFNLCPCSPSVQTILAVLQRVLWWCCLTSFREHKNHIKEPHFRFHSWKLRVHTGKWLLAAAAAEVWVKASKKPYTSHSWELGLAVLCGETQPSASSIPGLASVQMGQCILLGSWECLRTRNYLCWGGFGCWKHSKQEFCGDQNEQGMGSWSSSCGELCRVVLFQLPAPVPFYSWSLEDFCSSSFVCLIPSPFPWGYLQPEEGNGSGGTALVDPFKKTFQARPALCLEFSFPSTEAALWWGETYWKCFLHST